MQNVVVYTFRNLLQKENAHIFQSASDPTSNNDTVKRLLYFLTLVFPLCNAT